MTELNYLNPSGKIVLRSVFKTPKITLEPAVDPRTGKYAKCVITNAKTLTEAQRDSDKVYIMIDDSIEVYDGYEFNLDDPTEAAWWDAVKHSKLISHTRYLKDERGNLVIDGNSKRYGTAELYVEVPGNESAVKIGKARKVNQAENFIFNASENDLRNVAKMLGTNMGNSLYSDIQEFLLDKAKRNPDDIIDAFTGDDASLRLLLIEAIEKYIIIKKSNLYQYGEGIILGASQDAALLWMKDPRNFKVLEKIRYEVHPEWHDAPSDDYDPTKFDNIGSVAEVKASSPVKTTNPAKKATAPPSR